MVHHCPCPIHFSIPRKCVSQMIKQGQINAKAEESMERSGVVEIELLLAQFPTNEQISRNLYHCHHCPHPHPLSISTQSASEIIKPDTIMQTKMQTIQIPHWLCLCCSGPNFPMSKFPGNHAATVTIAPSVLTPFDISLQSECSTHY